MPQIQAGFQRLAQLVNLLSKVCVLYWAKHMVPGAYMLLAIRALNRSRVSITSQGSDLIVLIEAGGFFSRIYSMWRLLIFDKLMMRMRKITGTEADCFRHSVVQCRWLSSGADAEFVWNQEAVWSVSLSDQCDEIQRCLLEGRCCHWYYQVCVNCNTLPWVVCHLLKPAILLKGCHGFYCVNTYALKSWFHMTYSDAQ